MGDGIDGEKTWDCLTEKYGIFDGHFCSHFLSDTIDRLYSGSLFNARD